ncbi:MAG: choline-sulfatase, partial [Alphaproteobacteria bacterium]
LSAADPLLLYLLDDDPREVRNRAAEAAEADTVTRLRKELGRRWDVPALRQRVLESQRRRRWLAEAMKATGVAWDYQPLQDAASAYIRNTLPIYEIEKRSRYP